MKIDKIWYDKADKGVSRKIGAYSLAATAWPGTRHFISVVTAVDGTPPALFRAFVLAVAHSEHVYIPIPFVFLADFCH